MSSRKTCSPQGRTYLVEYLYEILQNVCWCGQMDSDEKMHVLELMDSLEMLSCGSRARVQKIAEIQALLRVAESREYKEPSC